MKHLLILSVLLISATTVWCQEPAATLTLDEAISLALQHNRLLKNEELEVAKAAERLASARTLRRPEFELSLLGLQTFTPLDFRFERGVFGTLPGGGPFPTQDIKLHASRYPNALLTARASQPLTQLRRINLGVKLQTVGQELAENKLEAQRRAVINQVKHSFYAVLQTQSALAALAETLKLHREMERLVGSYVAQQVVLQADSLDVKARLANDEYEAVKLSHTLAAQKEQLNLLLGRNLREDFTLAQVATENALSELDLSAAQTRALAQRSEIKEAELKLKQSGYQRRLKQAEDWPDVSLTFGYFAPFGVAVIPRNVAAVGVSVKWEPFDWGRRKHALKEIRLASAQAENTLAEARAQVLLDINQRFRKLAETRALLRVTQAAQRAAQERLRVALNKFKHEAVLFKEVLQTQTAVAEADQQQQQALLAFLTARADFERALGE